MIDPKGVQCARGNIPDDAKRKVVVVGMDEDELWNAFICISNLTRKPRENFYESDTREGMIRLRNKLHRIGKNEYGWV